MSILSTLAVYALRSALPDSTTSIAWLTDHWTDHSQTVPRALARANERAWQCLALALGGESWLETGTDWLRGSDVTQLRAQLREFWNGTAGYAALARTVRTRAAAELHALRNAGVLAELDRARVTADVRRYHAPLQLLDDAVRTVSHLADALAERAPHLAQVLRHTPTDAPPLLVTAFVFFFRREVETNAELARNLTFEQLRHLTAAHDAGLTNLCTQLDHVAHAQAQWFAAADAQLQDIRGQLEQLLHARSVSETTTEPLRVSVTNEAELALLRRLRDELRHLPPEVSAAGDWARLGDGLAAGGLFREASEAQQMAAAHARAGADRTAEAAAAFKHYRAACETDDFVAALPALLRAATLDPARYAPFPLHRYSAQAILGAGGFGTVFHCIDRYAQNRSVAIKALLASDLNRDLATVFAEAHTLGQLQHPGIVRVIDQAFADAEQTRPYIVMAYFPGISLASRLKQQGRLPPEEVIAITRAAASALGAAHAQGILHRDLKPGNLLVGSPHADLPSPHAVQLIDFGLAVRLPSVLASLSTSVSQRTRREQSFAGTLEYAAPEQKGLLPGVPVGPAADVYSLGKTCLEALLGTPEPISDDWDTLPEEWRTPLRRVLERCIARQPDRRFANCLALDRALAEVDPAEQARRAAEAAAEAAAAAAQAEWTAVTRANLGRWLATSAPERWVRARLAGMPQAEWQTALLTELEAGPFWPLDTAAVAQALLPIRDRLRTANGSGTERRPGSLVNRALRHGPRVEMQMAWIPPGTFLMGDTEFCDEQPVQRVTFERGFWMSCTPITQAQWVAVQHNNPSHFRGDDQPVECVSWDDANRFCAELSQRWGQRVTLPSEAQWEYACRAGTTTPYHCGATLDPAWANFDARETWNGSRLAGRLNRTTPVCAYPPNRWNLYDLHGNVWEWCGDGYGPYPDHDRLEPRGFHWHPHNANRVVRGGAFDVGPLRCRSAFRHFEAANYRGCWVGFRIVVEE